MPVIRELLLLLARKEDGAYVRLSGPALMDTLQTDGGWVDPTGESPNRIKYFEKTYENDSGFKAFVVKQMLPLLERYNVYNNIPYGSQPCQ